MSIMTSPQILPCGHDFCDLCLTECASQALSKCPICREEIDISKKQHDYRTQNKIDRLKVKCKFEGCGEVLPLKDMIYHEENLCCFVPFRCCYCGSSVLYNELLSHFSSCSKFPSQCGFCKELIENSKTRKLPDHICIESFIRKCGKLVLDHDLEISTIRATMGKFSMKLSDHEMLKMRVSQLEELVSLKHTEVLLVEKKNPLKRRRSF